MALVLGPVVTVEPVAQGLGSEVVNLGGVPDNYPAAVEPVTDNPRNWNLAGYLLIVRSHPELGSVVTASQEMFSRSRTALSIAPPGVYSQGYTVFVQCPPWVLPQQFQLRYDNAMPVL